MVDAQVQLELKKYEAAATLLIDIIEKYPSSRVYDDAIVLLGDALFKNNDLLSARRYLEMAIKKAMSLKAMANVMQTQKFFEEEQRTMPLEDVVERLRRRTAIHFNGDGSGRIRIA